MDCCNPPFRPCVYSTHLMEEVATPSECTRKPTQWFQIPSWNVVLLMGIDMSYFSVPSNCHNNFQRGPAPCEHSLIAKFSIYFLPDHLVAIDNNWWGSGQAAQDVPLGMWIILRTTDAGKTGHTASFCRENFHLYRCFLSCISKRRTQLLSVEKAS